MWAMNALIRAGALALALLLAGCGDGDETVPSIAAPVPAIPAPGNGDWTRIVATTAEGGFRVGNPDAPVQLVEYASLTCPHCAKFSRQATGPLMQLVKSGHLSWEFRHYLLFPTDPPASLLARCAGPGQFFPLTERLFAEQSDWSDKLESVSSAELERIRALPPKQQAAAMVKSAGLDALLRQSGVPQTQIDACLADERGLEQLEALTRNARSRDIRKTPTFLINGSIVPEEGGWSALRPQLQRALSTRGGASPGGAAIAAERKP
jgi:protein-disulfide isomerase